MTKVKTYRVVGISLTDRGILEAHPFVWDAECNSYLRFKAPSPPWKLSDWNVSELEIATWEAPTPDLFLTEGDLTVTVADDYRDHLKLLGWWEPLRAKYNLNFRLHNNTLGVCKPGEVAVTCKTLIEDAGKIYAEEFAKGDSYPSARALTAWNIRLGTHRWFYRDHMLESLVHSLWVGDSNRASNELRSASLSLQLPIAEVKSRALLHLKHIPDRDFASLLQKTGVDS